MMFLRGLEWMDFHVIIVAPIIYSTNCQTDSFWLWRLDGNSFFEMCLGVLFTLKDYDLLQLIGTTISQNPFSSSSSITLSTNFPESVVEEEYELWPNAVEAFRLL